MPRRLCGDWDGGLIWLHVVSDSVIFLAYLWIPLTMFWAFRSQGNKLIFPRATWLLISLYIGFITTCGFTHFFDVLMFWHPVYRINGVVRALTALVSILTAISLSRLIPIAVTAPLAIDAQKRLVEQQQAWLRDILDAATNGVLHLCASQDDLPTPLAKAAQSVTITGSKDLGTVRQLLTRLAKEAGFAPERKDFMITAAHEAAMNALRHAGGGVVHSYGTGDAMQVWIEDAGQGIPLDRLPISTLKQGYSTMGTAGQGWFLMLSSVDTAFLNTGASGTTVVLQMNREAPDPFHLVVQGIDANRAQQIALDNPVVA